MITFKSITDLAKLSRDDPARAVVQNLTNDFPRDPDTHGYIVLLEEGDTEITLPELKGNIADLSFDGVTKRDGHYHAVYCTNNSFAIEFVVPDAEWLPAAIKASLDAHAEKEESYMRSIKAPPF